ncbi:MAG: hypothetical protein H7A39_02990 [Chlamydiales bacterium]|nr:hypothetical protein [Chlamydiales bacterium]
MLRLLAMCLFLCSVGHAQIEPNFDFRLGSSILDFYKCKLTAAYDHKPSPTYNRKFAKQTELDTQFMRLLNERFSISKDQIKRLHSVPRNYLFQLGAWNPCKWNNQTAYSTYIDILRETGQAMIPQALEELNLKPKIDMPVIHYRLSDVPFCRQMSHHLQYYAFYDRALDNLKKQGMDVSKVLIIYTFKNGYYKELKISHDKFIDINKKYLNDFIEYLNGKGHQVTVQSKSVLEDFATMVFAPALIGSESVFSLFAGLANKEIFISPLIGEEHRNRFGPSHNCPAFMLPIQPLLHSKVINYYDCEDVFAKLRETPPK